MTGIRPPRPQTQRVHVDITSVSPDPVLLGRVLRAAGHGSNWIEHEWVDDEFGGGTWQPVAYTTVDTVTVALDTGEETVVPVTPSVSGFIFYWEAWLTARHPGQRTLLATALAARSNRASVDVVDPGVTALEVVSPPTTTSLTYDLRVRAVSPVGVARVACDGIGELQWTGGDTWAGTRRLADDAGPSVVLTVTAESRGSGQGDGVTRTLAFPLTLVDATPPVLDWTSPTLDGEPVRLGAVDVAVAVSEGAEQLVSSGLVGVTCTATPVHGQSSTTALQQVATRGAWTDWRGSVSVTVTGEHVLTMQAVDGSANVAAERRTMHAELLAPAEWLELGGPAVDGTGANGGVVEVLGASDAWDHADEALRGLDLWVRAADGHLWANHFDGRAWRWTDHGAEPGAPDVAGAVGVVATDVPPRPQTPFLIVHGADDRLWTRWLSESGWRWTDGGEPPGTAVSAVLAAGAWAGDPGPTAFVRAADGRVWRHRWVPEGTVDPGPVWADRGSPGGQSAGLTPVGAVATDERVRIVLLARTGELSIDPPGEAPPLDWRAVEGPSAGVDVVGAVGTIGLGGGSWRTITTGTDRQVWSVDADGSAAVWRPLGTPPPITGDVPFTHGGTTRGLRVADQTVTSAVDADGRLWVTYWDGTDGGYFGAGSPATSTATARLDAAVPATVRTGPGLHPHLFSVVRTTDGQMWLHRCPLD